jgi:lysophospholipase L1-like esterase
VLAAIVGSVLLAFGIAEVALRVAGYERSYANALNSFHENDPILGYRGRRNLERRFERPQFNVLIQHDENGFRRVTPPADPAKVRHQLVVFGDSVVWGWGVDQGKVVTDQLQRMMPDTRVFNRGINGAGTVMEYWLYLNDVVSLPGRRTVVVVFVWNDFFDNVNARRLHAHDLGNGFEIVLPRERVISGADSGLDSLMVLNAIHSVWSIWKIRRTTPSEPEQAAHLRATDTAAIVTRHYLELWRQNVVDEGGGRFLVAYFPGRREVPGEGFDSATGLEQDNAFRGAFESVALDAGVDTLDLLPAFLEAKRKTPGLHLLIPDDGHPNEAGHEVMARAIAEFLLPPAQRGGGRVGGR